MSARPTTTLAPAGAAPRRVPWSQSRFFNQSRAPTLDLYFGIACRSALASGRVERLAPTVLRAGDTLIVFRHAVGVGHLPAHRRLVYVIDDDVRAGLRDKGLPVRFRAKLAAHEAPAERRFAARADHVVTSSDRLARIYRRRAPGAEIVRLDPAWAGDAMPLPAVRDGATRIALLMGRSHWRDAAPLMSPLGDLLARRRDAVLTVSANLPVPPGIAAHPRVEVLPPLVWERYVDWLATARFDIGLAPHLARGPFNKARSASKLGEYASTGAAVIAAHGWPAARAAARAGRCLTVSGGPEAWIEATERLIEWPARRCALATENRRALAAADAAAAQRATWSRILGMEVGACVRP